MRCTGAPQSGHGCPYRPCTAISSWNAVTFSGNSCGCGRAKPAGPFREYVLRRVVEPADVCVGHLRGQRHGRQPRPMQDLIRVRVPDAAEQPRIGQRPFEGMALRRQSRGERGPVCTQYFESPAVECCQRGLSMDVVERRPASSPRFGEIECARRDSECREDQARSDGRRFPPPSLAPFRAPARTSAATASRHRRRPAIMR